MSGWQHALEARRDWLGQRGIAFIVTVVPEKQTIYPEYMPDTLVRGDSRLDQLIRYLREHSDLQILDLRPALLAAKAERRIYYRTNTHWNDLGAFVAYQTIVREMGRTLPGIRPMPSSDFEVVTYYAPSGDLTAMLGLRGSILEEQHNLRPLRPLQASAGGKPVDRNAADTNRFLVSEREGAGLPRMVMYRDSFASALIPFFAEHFSRATYVWSQQFDPSLIEAERPDIVLEEMAERLLMAPAPEDAFIGDANPNAR
jgi:alginate O-acetyltransferase complex protein AlgJ